MRAILAFITILIIAVPTAVVAAGNPLTLTVNQVFATSSHSVTDTFMYRLLQEAPDNPMPAGSTNEGYAFMIAGNTSVEIGPMSFSRQGLYKYEVFQATAVEKSGYTYDKRIYTVEVYVGPALNAEVIVRNDDGKKTDKIVFENVYYDSPGGDPVLPVKPPVVTPGRPPEPPVVTPGWPEEPPSVTPGGTENPPDAFTALPSDPDLMMDPPIKKTVFGSPVTDSVFTFVLEARDQNHPMPAGSTGNVKTIRIAGSGEGEFGTWSYEKAGVYYYTISEVNGRESGYTYDSGVYTITDSVRAENGRLVVYRVVTNNTNKPVNSCVFVNNYAPTGGGWNGKPDGPKTGDDSNSGFYFSLFVTGGIMTIGAIIALIRTKRGIHSPVARRRNTA